MVGKLDLFEAETLESKLRAVPGAPDPHYRSWRALRTKAESLSSLFHRFKNVTLGLFLPLPGRRRPGKTSPAPPPLILAPVHHQGAQTAHIPGDGPGSYSPAAETP